MQTVRGWKTCIPKSQIIGGPGKVCIPLGEPTEHHSSVPILGCMSATSGAVENGNLKTVPHFHCFKNKLPKAGCRDWKWQPAVNIDCSCMQGWLVNEIQNDDSGCPCIQRWVADEIQYDDAGCPCNQGWVALPLYFLFRSFPDLGHETQGGGV